MSNLFKTHTYGKSEYVAIKTTRLPRTLKIVFDDLSEFYFQPSNKMISAALFDFDNTKLKQMIENLIERTG